MTETLFYHLERATLDTVLPGLLEKSLERGWKALVRVGRAERVAPIDDLLWTYRDDSFLPHGASGDGARQPIWLTTGGDAPNSADILFLVEGARADAASLSGFKRSVVIFNGGDDDDLANARSFWKEVKAAGHDATYWRQTASGRWEKQA